LKKNNIELTRKSNSKKSLELEKVTRPSLLFGPTAGIVSKCAYAEQRCPWNLSSAV